jgi:Uma2 family endonuclease
MVGEILSSEDPDKDLLRNVDLYLRVPSIMEYWIIDGREDAERPLFIAYRRYGRRWRRPLHLTYGDTYTTKLLPGFELLINPLA